MNNMNDINEVKIQFKSFSINESFARTAVSSYFAQLNPTVADITDLKTAVSEAVTNCIVHAYKDTIGTIYITLKVVNENTAYIKIRDKGCGIENINQAMQPLFTTSPNDDRAGIGFAVMQSFTDKLKVYSTLGKGTTVIMTKQLRTREK